MSQTFYDNEILHIKQPIYHFFDGSKIHFKQTTSLDTIIKSWQQKIHRGFQKLLHLIEIELGVSQQQLEDQFTNEELITKYYAINESEYLSSSKIDISNPNIIFKEENEIDPGVLNFIKTMINKYTTKRNIKIILTNQIPTFTATYGTDLLGHTLLCNSTVYSAQNIKNYYNTVQTGTGFFYLEKTKSNSIRMIETSSLLLFGLTEAASSIQHQINYSCFLITQCSFQEKHISLKTAMLCLKLYEMLSYIESTMQSNNPLEIAFFIYQSPRLSKPAKHKWKKIVQSLVSTYDTNSVEKLKYIIAQMKNQSLNQKK